MAKENWGYVDYYITECIVWHGLFITYLEGKKKNRIVYVYTTTTKTMQNTHCFNVRDSNRKKNELN